MSMNGLPVEPKKYMINGTRWQQGELLFGDFTEVYKLLRHKFGSFNAESNEKFGAWLDEIVLEGAMPKLLSIILKPDCSGSLRERMWNSLLIRAKRLKGERLANKMGVP